MELVCVFLTFTNCWFSLCEMYIYTKAYFPHKPQSLVLTGALPALENIM